MKLISFNVNGIRASMTKGLRATLEELDADIVCLQETKATPDQVEEALEGLDQYHIHAHSAEKAGYSGTAILCRQKPERVVHGIGVADHDQEGRVITLTFPDLIVVNAYVPNSGEGLKRLDHRKLWDDALRAYLVRLASGSLPVVFCGDLNVAHRELDIARPKANYNKSAGYTQLEIDGLDTLLNAGFVDTFRALHPEEVKYSWWSYRAGARGKNIGWRIDYVLVSERMFPRVKGAFILNDVHGSDHCPVGIIW